MKQISKPRQQQRRPKSVINADSLKKGSATAFFLYDFVVRNISWVGVFLISTLVLIIFHNFLFGNLYYLFKDIGSDSLNWTYPSFIHMSNYLRKEGFPLWSFAQGMGQSVATSLNDPFAWIIYLGGPDNVAYLMIWMEIVKISLTAFIFYHFLGFWSFSGFSKLIGVMLYSFSGFVVVGSGWTIFSTEACYLALLLLAFEKLYQRNSWYLFPIAIFLLTILQPFNLYLYGLFLVFYFALRSFLDPEISWKRFIYMAGKMILYGLLGLIMSSFFLILFIHLILDSPRVGGNSSYFNQLFSHPVFFVETTKYYITALLRFFHNDLEGNGVRFSGWFNYLEAPLFYIGLFPLMLFPQVFVLEEKRKKIGFAVLFLIFLIPLIFPFFRYLLWFFTGDYFRGFSLFLSLPLLLFSLSVFNLLDHGRKINPYVLIVTAVVFLLIIYYPYSMAGQVIREDHQGAIRNFIILYTAILLLFTLQKYNQILSTILLILVFFETGFFNYQSLKERDTMTRQEMKQKTGYNDYTIDAINYLKSRDKQFFRVHKNYYSTPSMHESYNDGKAQGFFGTRSYSSFNQKYYIRFLEEMYLIKKGNEAMSRWSTGLSARPLLQHLSSTKYQLVNGPIKSPFNVLYDSVTMFGDIKVLRNKNFLPLGFTYDSLVRLSDFQKASPLERELIIQKAIVVDDSISDLLGFLPDYPLKDTVPMYTLQTLSEDVRRRKADTLEITSFSENRITGNINPTKKKLLFLSIPYDRGWHAVVDGKDAKTYLCNIGFLGLIIEPGKHVIELYYRPPYFYVGMFISALGFLIYFGAILGMRYFNKLRKIEE